MNVYDRALLKIKNDEKCKQNMNFCAYGPTGPTGPTGSRGEAGPKGDKGDKGDSGTAFVRTAYLVTFNNGNFSNGRPISSLGKIPIERSELDLTNLVSLEDSNIKFNVPGYYKITAIISAYVSQLDDEFNPTSDFISIGFRLNDTDNIYIGGSSFVYGGEERRVVIHGVIAVPDVNDSYSLVNLSNQQIYLSTPDITDIESNSYFSNSYVSMIIEYLGRQSL